MPPSTRTHYLLSYDIEDDGARQKLATLLLDYGDRVQKSVYEADLDDLELRKVLQRAQRYIGEEDSRGKGDSGGVEKVVKNWRTTPEVTPRKLLRPY